LLDSLFICRTGAEEAALIRQLVERKSVCVLSFLNAHGANIAWRNSEFLKYLADSDVLVRDGVGLSILLRILGCDAGLNLNGTDFIPKLLNELPHDRSIAVYGTKELWLNKTITLIRSLGFKTVYAEHGFHQDEYYSRRYTEQRPSLVILGMGMPKQERVALLIRSSAIMADVPTLIVNGGAVIDFMANRFPRAPHWMRQWEIEWLFRLMQEPKRLWRRNIGSIVFLYRALLTRCFR